MRALILLFLFLSIPLYTDSLKNAQSWEEKADYPRALAAYRSWLKENPSAEEFLPVLFRAARISPDPGTAVHLLDDFLPLAPENRAGEILSRKAYFLETVGDFAGAQVTLEEASRRASGEEALSYLLRSAELLLETGELEKSMEQARDVASRSGDPGLKKRGIFHLARLFAATGNRREALRLSKALTEDRNNREGTERILYFNFEMAHSLGLEEEKKAAYRRLEEEYPHSPELGLARLALDLPEGVRPFPVPSAILGAQGTVKSPDPSPPRSSPGAPSSLAASSQLEDPPSSQESSPTQQALPEESPTQRPWAVQTGSFSVRENAEYMARDLEGLGFSAQIRDELRPDGRTLYKVLIPLSPGEDSEGGSQRLLIQLKEKGIEGFLIFSPEGS